MNSITTPTAEEFRRCRDFYENRLKNGTVFTVQIADKPYSFKDTEISAPVETEKDGIKEFTKVYSIGDIRITVYGRMYSDLPVVEWYLNAKNTGKEISRKIRFNAMDAVVEAGYASLYHHNGSDNRPDDHQPRIDSLGVGRRLTIAPLDGRSSNHEYPYFTLSLGYYGINFGLGYVGQWEAEFFNNAVSGVNVRLGQQRLNSVMLPDEEFRSPRVVAQFWEYAGLIERNAVRRSQNIFRRYIREYNMPRYADGTIPTHGMTACSSHQFLEMVYATTEDQKNFIDLYEKRGIKLDYWWCDAGWYPADNQWDEHLGSWRYDERRFPNGIKEIADYAKSKGEGLVLWHEIERFRKDSDLYREHPEFALSRGEENPDTFLINFGNKDAVDWAIDKISSNLNAYGVTIYRQDMNVNLMPFIAANETPERQGALENHYAMGMVRYWDGLKENVPGLMIDMCAAGGRRHDLDTLKRALIFIRSDWLFEPSSMQAQTAWISEWIPFAGSGVLIGPYRIDNRQVNGPTYDRYALISSFTSHNNSCLDVRDENLEWDKIAELYAQWHDYVDCLSGDFYHLTENVISDDNWAAWQFNRPEFGDGVIQAFRRPFSLEEERTFRVYDLDPEKTYLFHRYDNGEEFKCDGKTILEKGIRIRLDPRSDAEIKYTVC